MSKQTTDIVDSVPSERRSQIIKSRRRLEVILFSGFAIAVTWNLWPAKAREVRDQILHSIGLVISR